jgi:hypothetical protein
VSSIQISEFEKLAAVARRSLPRMLDPATGLYAHKSIPTEHGFENLGVNALYSAASVIGLLSDEEGQYGVEPTLGKTLDSLVAMLDDGASGSLLGTTLWALTLAEDRRRVHLVDAIRRGFRTEIASSMDNGLALAGLATALERCPELRDHCYAAAASTAEELRRRLASRASLFRGAVRAASRSILYGGLTSFASQVYAIHGLAILARATGTAVAPEARLAAERLVELQGGLGQWWWFYATRTEAVLEGYPVYSVHQDGMAFMALATLQNLGEGSFSSALWLGLEWVNGKNELAASLVDRESDLVFRCIQRVGSDPDAFGGISRANRTALLLASFGVRPTFGGPLQPERLEILRECRSYHLGWLLYARSLVHRWSNGQDFQ